MENLFLTVLNMSLTGAFVITAICLARLLLKKAPKIISYCLWAVAWFRLAFPISIESALSLIPFRAAPIQQIAPTPTVTVMPPNIITQVVPSAESGTLIMTDTAGSIVSSAAQTISTDPMQILLTAGAYAWLVGFVLMLVYGLTSYIRLKNKMKSAIPAEADVYETDKIRSPFVLGFSKPKIYIPNGLSLQERTYIILHERTHIRRCDHIIKIASYFVLCLHWFNPLAWLAFLLMGADMEMSCDERVMKETGGAAKKEYSDLLLSLSANHRVIGGSPPAFSEGGLKSRIKNVLSFKKSSKIVVAVAIAFAAALSMGLLVNGTGQAESNILPDEYSTEIKLTTDTTNEQGHIETTDSLDFRFRNNMDHPIIDVGVNERELFDSLFKPSVGNDMKQDTQVVQFVQEDRIFGIIRETTNVYYTSTAEHPIGHEFGHGDSGQIFPGAVVEIIGPWDNGRVQVVVTSEGGPDAHNGWQTWKLWIDVGVVDVVDGVMVMVTW